MFIGEDAHVLPNTVIGDRVIVGVGAVVRGDIPDGVVVGGVPAKVICSFDDDVERLRRRNAEYP